jgi:hypothetical protein
MAFEVRSFFGTPSAHAGRHDALREAQCAAAAGGRFVFIYHLGAVELMPYCPGPGSAIAPNGGQACGRGDIGDGLYCPGHLATHHPDPESPGCPECAALPGSGCVATTGRGEVWLELGQPRPVLWCHEERHAAAIRADGRTCANSAGEPEMVQGALFGDEAATAAGEDKQS